MQFGGAHAALPAHELVSRIQNEDSWVQLTRVANRRPQAGKAAEALASCVLSARAVAGTRSLWLQAVVHIILQGGGGNRGQSRLISQSAAATLLRAVSSDASQHPPPAQRPANNQSSGAGVGKRLQSAGSTG